MAMEKFLLAIIEVIHNFSAFTRLQVNMIKSLVVLSTFIPNKRNLLQILCFLKASLPLKYLGVPIIGRELSVVYCVELIERLQNYLDKWRNQTISYGGRLQLANWVLMGRLNYWFLGLQLPREVLRKARQIIYRYNWNKGRGMAWWIMKLPKSEGGLGL